MSEWRPTERAVRPEGEAAPYTKAGELSSGRAGCGDKPAARRVRGLAGAMGQLEGGHCGWRVAMPTAAQGQVMRER